MGGFSADWLALREPADARARSASLTRAVADRLRRVSELHVLDLATGTGANVRYLTPFFSTDMRRPHWLLVDNDHELLAKAKPSLATGQIETRVLDLADAFAPASANLCAGQNLVTASALLDLVSARWLDALAARCRDAGAAVLFALTYNGDIRCEPEEPEDDLVRALVNRHQRTDKGFGTALGPDATRSAASAFRALRYQVREERSDWLLAPDARDLQLRLIEGWAEAAGAIAPERSELLRSWRARRLAHVAAGRSRMIVGHEDLAAWLA